MAVESPCMDCNKKGCGAYHDKCEIFKRYKALSEAEKENNKKYLRETAWFHVGAIKGTQKKAQKSKSRKNRSYET